jgi:hypothetical protein
MSDRPLTVMIPEPLPDGRCNPECPLYEYWAGDCSADEWHCIAEVGQCYKYGMRPGPGCPQYKEASDEE